MLVKGAYYTTDCSDLVAHVISIRYKDTAGRYIKVKIRLFNKYNRIQYDIRPKNYKLYLDDIKHWYRFNPFK